MDLGISNRVALVCGGSRGIGFAAAEILAREGVSVMICSRDAASVNSATEKLRAINPTASGGHQYGGRRETSSRCCQREVWPR